MVIQRIVSRAANLIVATSRNNVIAFNQFYTNEVNNRLVHTSRCTFAAAGRLYTDKHEWVEVNAKIGTIGISQYAQEALGDVVYAQLPDVDTMLNQKDECGTLESVKAASEIYSPVSGKVVDKNKEVEEKPSLINTACYGKGWLYKIELSNETELGKLMNEDQYKEFLKTNDDH